MATRRKIRARAPKRKTRSTPKVKAQAQKRTAARTPKPPASPKRKARPAQKVKTQKRPARTPKLPAGLRDIGQKRHLRERDRERAREKRRKEKRAKKPLSKAETRQFFGLGRGETKSLAKRAGVSEATIRRWEREGIPEKRKKGVRTALDRSRAAKRAVGFREGLRTRRELVGPLHGSRRADRMLLESMIDSRDSRWLAFQEKMRKLGFSAKGTRDEWFSPKMKK